MFQKRKKEGRQKQQNIFWYLNLIKKNYTSFFVETYYISGLFVWLCGEISIVGKQMGLKNYTKKENKSVNIKGNKNKHTMKYLDMEKKAKC